MRNRIRTITNLTLILLLTPAGIQAQQGGTTRFVYDDNGRLTAVISPNGEAAIYDYDAAGNSTGIRRSSADTLMLLDFFPHEGGARDEITFVGTGFNAGVTSVHFNGVAAQISRVTLSAVVAVVPDLATTGPVIIVTPRGVLVTPIPFAIVTRVRVFPSAMIVLQGESILFTSVIGGGGDQSVVWTVNGIVGGNNTIGTISPAGFFTAPATLTGNSSLSVAVRATSVAEPVLFGEAQVKVLNLNNVGTAFASVSVKWRDPVAVRAARAPLVSVRRGLVISTPAPFPSPMLSVRFGFAQGTAPAIFSQLVSASKGPSLSSVSPGSIARGVTVTLTLNGANLAGASALRFITSSGAIDTAIIASNIGVNADGTQITATVVVSSVAATGDRAVVVTTPSGTTQEVTTGSNTLTIQ